MSQPGTRDRAVIVGAGPAGLYTASALLAGDIQVDVIDRLPTPFGLVRYGVAPDHPQMKSVATVLRRPLDDGRCRFVGNVDIESDPSVEDLRRHYRAVVLATGCPRDRALGVPGKQLEGCLGSGQMVAWYNGHPEASTAPPLDHSVAIVVGGGNVALDIARVLARPAASFESTDMSQDVLDALAGSGVHEVHILVHRGPCDARFTTAEFRRLVDVDDIDVVVDERHLLDVDEEGLDAHRAELLALLRSLAARPARGGTRRVIHLHFHHRIVQIRGPGRVDEVVVDDSSSGLSVTRTCPVGLVISAIGYRPRPIPGIPLDPRGSSVPHESGRVDDGEGPVPGLYVTGWLKRGPSGVIGTNKRCAKETAAAVLADWERLPAPAQPVSDVVDHLAAAWSVDPTSWADWLDIESAEERHGRARGAPSVKLTRSDVSLSRHP